MKKVLLSLMMLMAGMTINAQVITLTDGGVYEKKEVVKVDSVKASELFVRAMEALSDWTGPDGRSKAGIDYQDKESGTIIYKGNYYMGFRHVILRAGWDMFADFTMKVRCKDGRAQITMTIPSMTGKYSANNNERTVPLSEIVNKIHEKGKKKRPTHEYLPKIPEVASTLISAMCERLKQGGAEDDDF
jgi:hypothetical protein